MSEVIGDGQDAVLHAGGEKARKRSCNRHDDCDSADAKAIERGSKYGAAEHCHDDCCEDCFGS